MSTTHTLTKRQKIGLQSSWQAESMLRVLLGAAHHGDMEDLPCLVQAMVPRLLQLNSVAMSAHDEDSDTLEAMREGLHGGYQRLVQGSDSACSMDTSSVDDTNPCATCPDNSPLPVAVDFFDKRVVQDYIQRRTACDLCPADVKPCLKGAQHE